MAIDLVGAVRQEPAEGGARAAGGVHGDRSRGVRPFWDLWRFGGR
jgi:hypothetical protein